MAGSPEQVPERPPLRALIVRPQGEWEFELRVVPYDDIPYYAATGWTFVATDPADEAHLATWILRYGVPRS